MIINITNGEFYNKYFEEQTKFKGIPFNEVMMSGPAVFPIFTKEFIKNRSKYHYVSSDEYIKKMEGIINLKNIVNEIDTINLFFGNDTYCVINLLTVLAYLEELKYKGAVTLNTIDDYSFKTLESGIDITLGIYSDLYKSIVINKEKPTNFGVLNARAIDLYFDFLDDDGYLARIVKENINKSIDDLVVLLLDASMEYGLSDLLILELINRVKENNYL